MTDRVETAKRHLTWYDNKGGQFLNSIVAIDNAWLRSYEPEWRSQSSEWHNPDLPRLPKFREKKRTLKELMSIAWGNRGVLSMDFIPV